MYSVKGSCMPLQNHALYEVSLTSVKVMETQNNIKEPLLPRSLDRRYRKDIKKRRLRRARSTPLIDRIPQEPNNATATQVSDPLFILHPSFKKVAAYFSCYLGIGAICFYAVRYHITGKKTNGIVDALYFCMVTMTTVGYGDLVPESVPAKLLACVFAFSGMALVGSILSQGADYLIEKQEALIVKSIYMSEKLGPSDIMKEIETNKTRYKCAFVFVFLLILIGMGTIFLNSVEKLSFLDAFYCVCVTITTLGYGDHSFSTEGGRIFAVLWILTSTLCLALFFLYVTEHSTESRQKAIVEHVLTRPVTNVDLEAADLDDNGTVTAAEFVIYKLKEMGKITQEDVSLVLEQFEELDFDQSGTLSLADITLAQSSPPVKPPACD